MITSWKCIAVHFPDVTFFLSGKSILGTQKYFTFWTESIKPMLFKYYLDRVYKTNDFDTLLNRVYKTNAFLTLFLDRVCKTNSV